MKCENCGAEFEGNFCPNCGEKRSEETETTPEKQEINPEKSAEYYEALKKIESEKEEKNKKSKKKKLIGCSIPIIILVVLIIIGCVKITKFFKPASKEENKTSTTEINNQQLIEISDTIVCLNREHILTAFLNNISLTDFSFNVKNKSDKTIEHINFTISLYNDEGVEKCSIKEKCDKIISPNEQKTVYNNNYVFYYNFSDVFIDETLVVDLDSIKISSVEIQYSDETEETIDYNKKIDKCYYQGVLDDTYYYCQYSEYFTVPTVDANYGVILNQKSISKSKINEKTKEMNTIPKIYKIGKTFE